MDADDRRAARQLAQNRKPWLSEIKRLQQFGADHGLDVEVRNPGAPHYQIAALTATGVRLVVYPHRTRSTGNVMPRVRDENSADKARATELIYALGLYQKNNPASIYSFARKP